MTPHIKTLVLSLGFASVSANTVQACLIDRGNGLIYDAGLNITWLADADANGAMTWSQAMTWAGNLTYGGYAGWRLPTTSQPDATCGSQSSGVSQGYNCTGSEIGHLFYNELGGVAGLSINTTHNTNYNLFRNVQSDVYWSSTEDALSTGYAWNFHLYDGGQNSTTESYNFYAMAVHPGDITTLGDLTAVPIPATAWLFGSGLLGLASAGRARRRR